eukprot:evm.model.scf_604.4 EVM.evm.TU.scf_604.4   scf_604:38992-47721(+)
MDPPDVGADAPEIVVVQSLAMIDHVCKVGDAELDALLRGTEAGGSRPVPVEELRQILAQVGEFHSKAGGSAANTARGLAAGFGVRCHLVGARGQDEWGVMFASSLKRALVNTDKLRVEKGSTGRCAILSNNGERTMRTCLQDVALLQGSALKLDDFTGAKWVYTSGYSFYQPGLVEAMIAMAKKVGAKVALDLASFEIVRSFRSVIEGILESGAVDCCLCNEDEAIALVDGQASGKTCKEALQHIAAYSPIAVVTLGERGCLFKRKGEGGGEPQHEPAISDLHIIDSTGAGDIFNSGFLYGLLRGFPTRRCAQIGCLAGAAVVQELGAECSADGWQWFHARLHGELAATVVRCSAEAVHQELLECYALIQKVGRGVVYYGSARVKEGSQYWDRAVDLGRQVASLLNAPTWSGGGPGMMRAASVGAKSIGGDVAGIRISREAGTTVRTASYLPEERQVVCRYLSPRKVALVDAGVRESDGDRTAYMFLPGGLGTMDELFEIVTLYQLKKLGTKLEVPLVLCNYDGFYDGLMSFLQKCQQNGTVSASELSSLVIADTNAQVVAYLAEFYGLQAAAVDTPAMRASSWINQAELGAVAETAKEAIS